MKEYDVAIIGAGSAGLSARREVEKATKNYILIDNGPLGTTCARVGCMPSKVLIQVANDFHQRHKLEKMGVSGGDQLNVDPEKVMSYVRSLRDRFSGGVKRSMEPWLNDHFKKGKATFIDKETLDVDGEKVKAKSIIIATGSKPILPTSWKAFDKYLFDTDAFFELETLPKKIAIIGLGVIGIELGQALSRLGVEVIGFSLDKAIGGLSDPTLQDYMAKEMESEFPIHYGASELVGENNNRLQVKSGDKIFEVDKAFLTMGRTPMIKNLNLESTGVPLNERGLPMIDHSTFNIEGTRVFVAGDCTGDRALLHEASDEGRIAGYNAVRETAQCFRRREFLAITFSEPNIAIVGQTFRELKNSSHEFVIGESSFESQGRAVVMQKNKGLAHIYADKKSGQLLGAELLAPSGEHLAHLLSWAISLKLNVYEALSLPFYHPVVEEGLRAAIRDAAQKVDTKLSPLEVLRCQDPPVTIPH